MSRVYGVEAVEVEVIVSALNVVVVAIDQQIGALAGAIRSRRYIPTDRTLSLADAVCIAAAVDTGRTLLTADPVLIRPPLVPRAAGPRNFRLRTDVEQEAAILTVMTRCRSRRIRRGARALVMVMAGACSSTATRPPTTPVPPTAVVEAARVGDQAAPSTAVADDNAATDVTCPRYTSQVRGTLPPPLTELSGWALSKRHADVLWGHNDSGEGARLIAVSALDGSQVGDVTISGATDDDWEDVATYLDPAGQSWIIVADTGDNAERRDHVQFVLIAEPELSASTVAAAGVITVRWTTGPHDVEALIADPVTGDLIVIGKRFDNDTSVSIDRLPSASVTPGADVEAEHLGTFAVPDGQQFGPTAGSINSAGTMIGLLFYSELTLTWKRPAGASIADTILGATPCMTATGSGKYESLAITDDGALLVATEGHAVPLVAYVPTS